MSAEANAALARDLCEAFNRSDLEAAAALASDDVEVPMGATFRGREAFRDGFMGGFKTASPDLTLSVTNQVATDDHVVSELRWHGKHDGALMTPDGEIPATGRRVEGARFCEVWRIADGRVSGIVNYQDVASWMRQLGLVQ